MVKVLKVEEFIYDYFLYICKSMWGVHPRIDELKRIIIYNESKMAYYLNGILK